MNNIPDYLIRPLTKLERVLIVLLWALLLLPHVIERPIEMKAVRAQASDCRP